MVDNSELLRATKIQASWKGYKTRKELKKVKNAFIKELGNHDGVELSKELKQKLNLKFDIKVKKTFINIGRNENQNAFDFIKENSEEYTKSNAFNILHENITTYKASLNTRTLSNITIEPCEVSKDMQENREDDKFKIHELVNDLLWIQKAIKDRKKYLNLQKKQESKKV